MIRQGYAGRVEPNASGATVSQQNIRRVISPDECVRMIKLHRNWLRDGKTSGAQFDATDAEISDGTCFAERDLSEARLDRAIIYSADFHNTKLCKTSARGAHLSGNGQAGANLAGVDFSDADLAEADLTKADLSQAQLVRAVLTKAVLHQTTLNEARMDGVNARAADFSNATIERASMVGADCRGAKFDRVKLHQTNLDRAILDGASLRSASMSGAHGDKVLFGTACLDEANLRQTSFTNADLRSASIRKTSFVEAKLSGSDLSGLALGGIEFQHAKLDACDLRHADLRLAQLHASDLSGALLTGAKLDKANLHQANLERADVTSASFRETILSNANISHARVIRTVGLFGPSRANAASMSNPEWAVYAPRWDLVHWAKLRSIGSLRLFGVSYAGFIAITAVATMGKWYNAQADRWHQWAANHAQEGPMGAWADLVARIPKVIAPAYLGWQLVMLGLLGFGATLYVTCCPEPIKEATETRWTRELEQPLIEYRAAMFNSPFARYLCFGAYLVGGGWTVGYLLWRGAFAILYLMG
jgi:uncharacterized protein YjbI with pentapeptide repeats